MTGKLARNKLEDIVTGKIVASEEMVRSMASEILEKRRRTNNIIKKVADLSRIIVEGADEKWNYNEVNKVFTLQVNNTINATVRCTDGVYGERWKWELVQHAGVTQIIAQGTTFSATNARRRVEDVIKSMARDVNIRNLNEENRES